MTDVEGDPLEGEDEEVGGAEDGGTRARFSRVLGDQLLGLLDPEGPIRRGQDMVTGVTQATKEEIMRLVSQEVRSFLDKMDVVDLLQQVVAGLVVDVNAEIRMRRAEDGQLEPEIRSTKSRVRLDKDGPEPTASSGGPGAKE